MKYDVYFEVSCPLYSSQDINVRALLNSTKVAKVNDRCFIVVLGHFIPTQIKDKSHSVTCQLSAVPGKVMM